MDQAEENSDAQSTIESLIKEMDDRLINPDDVSPATMEADAPACLISWVSDGTHAVDCGDYKPDRVLIGPFHWYPSHWMEKEKKELLHGLLPRDQPRRQRELRRYLVAMEALEDRARRCYNKTFSGMTSEAFACMLLLDGCFLLSCFPSTCGGEKSSGVDGAGGQESRPRVLDGGDDIKVVRDVVFLLENQIPFFVLEEIHKLTAGAEDDYSSVVVDNVAKRVEALLRRHGYVSRVVTLDRHRARPCHLLHLLYMYFRPTALLHRPATQPSTRGGSLATVTAREVQLPVHNPSINVNPGNTNNGCWFPLTETNNGSTSRTEDMPAPVLPDRWRAATYYHAAGVRLVKRELDGGEARSILDVELSGGTLHVPCLVVDSNTWRILRNMMALEQHGPRLGSHYVTAYCLFMSQMASTEEDVALLVRKGIVLHFLGCDRDVADGLATLCHGVFLDVDNPDINYLTPEQEALEELCRGGWRKSMAWLRHNKCNNYLMALAVAAGVIVFVCTVEQSVFAALGYVKGKNS